MISLSITKSKETIQEGDYTFNQNRLLISCEHKANIILPEKSKYFIEIHIIKKKLYLISPLKETPLLMNNKFTGSTTPLQSGDFIQIKNFEFKILDFSETEELEKSAYLNKETDIIIKEKPELLKKIKELQKNDN